MVTVKKPTVGEKTKVLQLQAFSAMTSSRLWPEWNSGFSERANPTCYCRSVVTFRPSRIVLEFRKGRNTISGIWACPANTEMAVSESACSIRCRWSIVYFSLISYRLGVIQRFNSKGNVHCEPKIWGFPTSHVLKFDLLSTGPRNCTSLRQNTRFKPCTPLCVAQFGLCVSSRKLVKKGKKVT